MSKIWDWWWWLARQHNAYAGQMLIDPTWPGHRDQVLILDTLVYLSQRFSDLEARFAPASVKP
jgi:hypothetical protein